MIRLVPRITGRSLPELEADAAALEVETDAARRRVDRLTELLRVEATSQAELERARATLAGLEARLRAARSGLDPARSPQPRGIAVTAPWPGSVAEVLVSPGQTVAAGAPLVRLVKLQPLWIQMAVRPDDAARDERPAGLIVRRPGAIDPVEVRGDDVRIVSRSPELDPATGTVGLILETKRALPGVPIGSAVDAELLLRGERRGIVVPLSALVDDGGVTVAYVQVEGESFARREARVLLQQGTRALVDGLKPGERLVVRGGAAIRRSSLLSSGAPEGHVH